MADLLYERVASELAASIRSGALRQGDKLPSVRHMLRDRRTSAATIVAAYAKLEADGLIEARPRSGYYVRSDSPLLPPRKVKIQSRAARVHVSAGVEGLVTALGDPSVLPLGAGTVSSALLPIRSLNRTLATLAREGGTTGATYEAMAGMRSLRRQLARRSVTWGTALEEDDFLITVGATEALHICLRALTRPGDVVAVESPTFFGLLQIIEDLGLRAVEIPVHPEQGIDLDALEQALRAFSIRACLAIPNVHNPLGVILSDERKEKLTKILARRGVPLVEDDIYGDLAFDDSRPRLARAFDRGGNVYTCGSVSKTLAAGYRVGWIIAPEHARPMLERLKYTHTASTTPFPQMAIAEYLASGRYDRHLRRLRGAMKAQVTRFRQAIAAHFPRGTRISAPSGGFMLWVEMPRPIQAMKLQVDALHEGIAIAPGPIFSARKAFTNCARISCGFPWSPEIEEAIAKLGTLAKKG
jgi:DNA-binding transcriptional MocR family regulator